MLVVYSMVLHNVQLSLLSEFKILHQLRLNIPVLPCFPFSQFILPTSYHSKFRKKIILCI